MVNPSASVNLEEDCDVETVVPVAAGDHTVDFVTVGAPAVGVTYDESALWALFVPFDGAGNPPSDFTVTGAGAGAQGNN